MTAQPKSTDCSFCKATKEQADYIIGGDDVNICGDCIRVCAALIAEKMARLEVKQVLGDYHRPDVVKANLERSAAAQKPAA